VRKLDVETVTKTALRTWTKANTPDATPRQDFIMSGLTRIEREAKALLAEDPDQGRQTVEECMRRLQVILDNLERPEPVRHTQTDILAKSTVIPGRHAARFRPPRAAVA
jgi:hypothetical protein